MCHILCFLTGAGLATYLARRKYRREVEDELDDYDRDVRHLDPNAPVPVSMPEPDTTGNPSTAPRDPKSLEDDQRAIRRQNASKSIGDAVDSVLEFFQNLGDAATKHPKKRATKAEQPQPQAAPPMDQKVAEIPPPPMV